jgi:hypothetical protein
MIADPKPRAVGVPSATIEDFDADERHVLWTASDCLLVADLTAPAAAAPDPGVCTRTEFDLDPAASTCAYAPTARSCCARGIVNVRARAVLTDPDGRRTIVARTYGARVR